MLLSDVSRSDEAWLSGVTLEVELFVRPRVYAAARSLCNFVGSDAFRVS
jgi:hypothetical protein